MRAYGALEPMQEKQAWHSRRAIESVPVDEVSIGSVPALEARLNDGGTSKALSPERLCVWARYPPCGAVGILGSAVGHSERDWDSGPGAHLTMEVQVFGTKKSADTRKALRFFSERRVKTHFVDLQERPASVGELKRFVQKFGIERLIDRDSKRFEELGLRHARFSE